jgi:hypothetical protein
VQEPGKGSAWRFSQSRNPDTDVLARQQKRPLRKYDNQPDSDQRAYADKRQAEKNSGREAFRLEVDLLAAHCTFPTRLS